jgi:endonuclease III
VKNAAVGAKKFTALLKKIGQVDPPEPAPLPERSAAEPDAAAPARHDPIATLVMSFLMWESTTDRADAAYQRILDSVVDFNELRVCMPHETVEIIGQRYPLALNRAQRLRAALRNIYLREHAMNLDKQASGGKRDLRKYVESLEGIVPYVAARVSLLCFDTHVLPVDEQMRTALIEVEVADASVEVPELATWLAMHVKASDIVGVHAALQSWMDAKAGASERKAARKAGSRKAARK